MALELKVRFYLTERKKFLRLADLISELGKEAFIFIPFILAGNEPKVTPSLYFGKGKDGQDLYHGDIIQVVNETGSLIKFVCWYSKQKREMKSGHEVEITGFTFISEIGFPTYPIVNNYKGVLDTSIFKLIGNVYEHPKKFKLQLEQLNKL